VIDDVSLAIWGGNPLNITLPGVLNASSTLPYQGIVYPNGRFFILGVSVVVAIGLYVLLRRTRVGAIIRAGVDDREMVSALGINVRVVFSAVFVLGTALAGFAGVLGVPVVGLATGNDTTILLLALAVVVIGGLGSYEGAVLGSIIIALADTYGTAYFPAVSYSVLFIPLVVVLLVRPQGLLGRRAMT
jgi:branched-chain amino acid transport system permease protein